MGKILEDTLLKLSLIVMAKLERSFTWLAMVHCKSMGSWMKSSNLVPTNTGIALYKIKHRALWNSHPCINIYTTIFCRVGSRYYCQRKVNTWFHFLASLYHPKTLKSYTHDQEIKKKIIIWFRMFGNFFWENIRS